MSYSTSQGRRAAPYVRQPLPPPPGRRLISYASSPSPSPPPPPRKRTSPPKKAPTNGERWPKDGWELLMQEERREGSSSAPQRAADVETRPEKRAKAVDTVNEQPSFTPSPPPFFSYDTPPHMRHQRRPVQVGHEPAHPPLRHKRGIVRRGSYRDPLPPPPSTLPRRPPTPLRLDPASPPPAASFAPPGLMSRPPVYHNGMRGGGAWSSDGGGPRWDDSFARGRPSQPAFAGASGARVPPGLYGRNDDGTHGATHHWRRDHAPAFAAPRRSAPAWAVHASSYARPFTFGVGISSSFVFSAGPPSHRAPVQPPAPAPLPVSTRPTYTPFSPASPTPNFPLPQPQTQHKPDTDSLPPSPPLTLTAPPSRLHSPTTDPGPAWLLDALYGPSHEEMCAWREGRYPAGGGRKRRFGEEEEGLGWDWEGWEREKGRKRARRAWA